MRPLPTLRQLRYLVAVAEHRQDGARREVGGDADDLRGVDAGGGDDDVTNTGKLTGDATSFALAVNGTGTNKGVAIAAGQLVAVSFLVFFMLASGSLFKRKLVVLSGERLAQRKITVEVLDEIDTQIRRTELERQLSPQSRAVRQQLELERARQEAAKAELQMRLREAEALELNSEFPQGTVESLVEVGIGDNLFNKIGRTEIIIKDGIILEIREEA